MGVFCSEHVYPYQITALKEDEISVTDAAYFQVGDYHDTVMIVTSVDVSMRYAATAFDGNVAVQCHRTDHADIGMITAEYVEEAGQCNCSLKRDSPGFTNAPTSNAPVVPTS